MTDGSFQTYELILPAHTPYSVENTISFLQTLQGILAVQDPLHLFIRSADKRLDWQIAFNSSPSHLTKTGLAQTLNAYYPGAELRTPSEVQISYPHYVRTLVFQRNNSIRYEEFMSLRRLRSDPLALVLQTMSQILPDELITYQIAITQTGRFPPDVATSSVRMVAELTRLQKSQPVST